MAEVAIDIPPEETDADHVPKNPLTDQALPLRGNGDDCLTSIQDKFTNTLNYGTVCIYKVPEKYRRKNQEGYMPRLVSIGLVHHGEIHLQAMEEHKLKYFNDFLDKFPSVSLSALVEFAEAEQKLACGCYEHNFVTSVFAKGKKPSEVLLLDGVFVIQLFLKNHFPKWRGISEGDMLFGNSWLLNEMMNDLLLLENQLPLKFLQSLYDKFVVSELGKWLADKTIDSSPSFYELAHKYFKDVGSTGKLSVRGDFQSARHLVEFLSILHRPQVKENSINVTIGKFYVYCPTATELGATGVNFKEITGSDPLGVVFNVKEGELNIQQFTINDSTETFLRNLMVFEQLGLHSNYVSSILLFFDNLIDNFRDVDLLVKHNIIRNELNSSYQVADLFNNMYKEFAPLRNEFLFREECRKLGDFSREWWHMILAVKPRSFRRGATLASKVEGEIFRESMVSHLCYCRSYSALSHCNPDLFCS